jgi:hypothetical protein
LLEAAIPDGVRRFVSELPKMLSLDGAAPQTWVTVTKIGHFYDPRYGEFDITRPMLLAMIENFNKGTYGQEIFLDVAHEPSKGSAGTFKKLALEGNKLRALIEWTPYGVDAVKERGFKYLSADYTENFQDNEKRAQHGPLLFGAGLTIRPVIKGNEPVQLSEPDGSPPTFLHPDLQTNLLQEIETMHKMLAEKLKSMLAGIKSLSEPLRAQLLAAFENAVQPITDEAKAKELMESFAQSGKTLAEQIAAGNKEIKLSIETPSSSAAAAATGLTVDDVRKLLAEETAAKNAAAKKLAEDHASNVKLLSDTINAATGLSEEQKKTLSEEVAPMISGDMSANYVKTLAEMQVKKGNELAAARQLSAMGFSRPSGTPHIQMIDGESKKLDGIYRDNLKKTSSFALGNIKLAEKSHPFVSMVLAEFDRVHGAAMHNEVKMLAGETGMANVNLPIGYQREVIREALSDTNILNLVQTMVDSEAKETTLIPYELRDVANIVNDGIVYEGQEIPEAGISQLMDSAYIQPMKIALRVSNEVMHFSQASGINWDAMGRNLASNATYMKELISRRIANALQQATDSFGAIAVPAESFSAQLTGATSIFKTVNYPIVRPLQERNLRGQAMGVAENPIAVILNSTAVTMYDGTGKQVAGTYYRVTNYNLGYFQTVNQLGVPVTPAPNAGVNTIAYSKATNILKVDLDVPNGSTAKKQLNFVLEAIGARKALLSGDRFVKPDFQLMSPHMNDMLTNAEQFTDNGQRVDATVSPDGDLTTVKGIPAFGTNAPGIDLGDSRIIIGQRGLLGYSVAKPFVFGQPFEAVGPNGQPIGKKIAYGEEYSAIKVPTPVRNRMTSVLAYSFTGR